MASGQRVGFFFKKTSYKELGMKKYFLSMILLLIILAFHKVSIGYAQQDKNIHAKKLNQMKTTLKKSSDANWSREIERLTGLKGTLDKKENVFKVSFPRSDLAVEVEGIPLSPPMGLTVWAAFKNLDNRVMMMGDMVLREDQVNPVMSLALQNGLEVTALHNHFLGDSPRVMFMHISGMGDLKQIAAAVAEIFTKIKETSAPGEKHTYPTKTSLDPRKIDDILEIKGQLVSGVYKVVIGKFTKMHGLLLGSAMGVNTWAAFSGSDENAVVDGDFVMYESELQPVLRALRRADINVVAIHNHMIGESPRVIFLHYWGIGKTVDLARGIKSALDAQSRRKK